MTIIEAVRILEENRPTIIWEDKEAQWREERVCKAIDAVAEHFKPVQAEIEGGGSSWWYVCEECRGVIDSSDSWCKHCGRPVKQT